MRHRAGVGGVARDASPALKEGGGRTGTASVRQRRIFGALVVAQFACAIVLMTSGGLLIRSFLRLLDTNPGFQQDNVVTLATSLPTSTYSNGAEYARSTGGCSSACANCLG